MNRKRKDFCFGVMKSLPLFLQNAIYNEGAYNQAVEPDSATTQSVTGLSTATGMSSEFMASYNVIENLDLMTNVSKGEENTFLFLANDMTHEPALLSEPEYVPSTVVDNTEFDAENADRFTLDGKTLKFETAEQMMHYQSNMAAYLRLADWFDYLRDNGVYDNTKIILVSDHAYSLGQSDEYIVEGVDMSGYFPLLMVKDFNAEGFTVSEEFMTNADVPTLATNGTIENPVNPFTGKAINSDEKTAHAQMVSLSHHHTVEWNNGGMYFPDPWCSVDGDFRDLSKLEFVHERIHLKQHKLPE